MTNTIYAKIKLIVEHVLHMKIAENTSNINLVDLTTDVVADDLSLLRDMLQNPPKITEGLRSKIITEQHAKTAHIFDLCPSKPTNDTISLDWDNYVAKLEDELKQVKTRRAAGYEYHKVMPPTHLLTKWQDECWQLTEQMHGKGNLSCFYLYFTEMSEQAGITSFAYLDISKNLSNDQYVSLVNIAERQKYYSEYEKEHHHGFVKQGGFWGQGRSVIDGTSISNIMYYKTAHKLFCFEYAKKLVVTTLKLVDYGQLPYPQRLEIWQLICKEFPDDTLQDQASIFHQYANYLNEMPGEYFNYLGLNIPEALHMQPQQLHDLVKLAGLQGGQLVLLSRDKVNDLLARRFLHLYWTRKYPLLSVADHNHPQVRAVGLVEQVRVWPNTIPYSWNHGLLLCGDCLPNNAKLYNVVNRDWNSPVDPEARYDNAAHDIEKLFRELNLICPPLTNKSLLPGEQWVYMFQNTLGYSTVPQTQHTHVARGVLEDYPVYMLPAAKVKEYPDLAARFELVIIGNNSDASLLRVHFDSLENEALIKYLIDFNNKTFTHFGGTKKFDVFLHITPSLKGEYVFIYEPHVRLYPVDRDFLNPESNQLSPRKPQYFIPQGERISEFDPDHPFASGLEYLRKFFDMTCKHGMYEYLLALV